MTSVAAKPHHRKQLNHPGAEYDNEYANMFNDSPFGIAVATGSCIWLRGAVGSIWLRAKGSGTVRRRPSGQHPPISRPGAPPQCAVRPVLLR